MVIKLSEIMFKIEKTRIHLVTLSFSMCDYVLSSEGVGRDHRSARKTGAMVFIYVILLSSF